MGAQRQGDNGQIQRDKNGAHYATPPVLECVGYEKLTISNTAVGFTNDEANKKFSTKVDTVCLRVETQNIRFRGEGEAPTATDGMLLATTDVQPVWIMNASFEELAKYRFIRATGADGTLHVLYYRVQG